MTGDETPPTECPKCHRQRVAAMFYGFPDFTDELKRDLDEGRIVLGGCMVDNFSPKWQCLDCAHLWGEMHFDDDTPGDAVEE